MAIHPFPSPSARLPSIRKLAATDSASIEDALKYLRVLYSPPVRGSRRRTKISTDDDELDGLRADAFERTHAVRWLTALVSHLSAISDGTPASELILADAASLLAICAGTAAAGMLARVFAFGSDVQVQLTDAPLENADFASVGAQTWGAACILSERIVESPQDFFASDVDNVRVLELGAGTGLVSLTVAKLLAADSAKATVVASDFHPSVLANLKRNITANFPDSDLHPLASSTLNPLADITAVFLDWSDLNSSSLSTSELFDVILGADIVYESTHAEWIKACLERLLRRPSRPPLATLSSHEMDTKSGGVFHLVIPQRATHARESQTVERVFPLVSSIDDTRDSELAILGVEEIVCSADRDEDVVYRHYRIGWS
ncbi:hypothetical protein PLICRDRAFT_43797 [Plicaturopsis crispa FD-325 SS-3]|nr:hypothetical protein PLICRDRAFT_43797 [Plicaturopsis crispa FD-325 SS-3]